MATLLLPGDVLSLRNGGSCTVEQLLGGGGQGEVHLVRMNGRQFAVKWYFPSYLSKDHHLAERIDALIDHGSVSDRFLWPLDKVSSPRRVAWGYVMDLRPDTYVGLSDLKWPRGHPRYIPAGYRFLAKTCDELVEQLRSLHLSGFCYVDLNPGNVFIAKTGVGGVRICDLDNVCFDNDNNAVVTGADGYMAPEVKLGTSSPNVKSDRHSLAVVLFETFMLHHPLVGRSQFLYDTYDDAIPEIFGRNPVFIFDEQNKSNYAVGFGEIPDRQEAGLAGARAIPRWAHLPGYLKQLFTRAFTDGLRDPNARVTEGEWRGAFMRMYDSAFPCPMCGNEVLYDVERVKANGTFFSCPFKGCQVAMPYRIRVVGNRVVVLNPDTLLFPHHIDSLKLFDFKTPVAEVVRHPTKPGTYGLRNRSNLAWQVRTESGSAVVESGKSVSIEANVKINFGPSEGEIRL